MQAQRCIPALRGDQSGDLVAGAVSHRWNFVAARTAWAENRLESPGIWRMSVRSVINGKLTIS